MSKSEWQKVSVDEASTLFREDPVSVLKEYERMRDIARKRMNRLKSDEFDWTKSSKEKFPAYTQMDRRDFAKAYSELSKFLSAKRSTLGGQKQIREKTTETLNKAIGAYKVDDDGEYILDRRGKPILEDGITAVNKRNYERVIKILNEARKIKLNNIYDSTKMVELADSTLSLSDKAFEAVLDNLESAIQKRNQFTHMTDLDGYSFDDIQNML